MCDIDIYHKSYISPVLARSPCADIARPEVHRVGEPYQGTNVHKPDKAYLQGFGCNRRNHADVLHWFSPEDIE